MRGLANEDSALILCMLGNCSCFRLSAVFFFKISSFKKLFQEFNQCQTVWVMFMPNVNGLNCLQRLSAEDASRQKSK